MSLYDVILKELDLNEGDEFTINFDSILYKLIDSKLYTKCTDGMWCKKYFPINDLLEFGITITKRAPWVPKAFEVYYYATPERAVLWHATKYHADDYDLLLIERGMAFKTQEEAEDCAKKMLDAIKED